MLHASPHHHDGEDDATATVNVTARKPFFIMDWLEEMIQDKDVETISEMLQTPRKASSPSSSSCPETPKSSNRKRHSRLLNDNNNNNMGTPITPSSRDLQKSLVNHSGYSPPEMERKRLHQDFFQAAAVSSTASTSTTTPTKSVSASTTAAARTTTTTTTTTTTRATTTPPPRCATTSKSPPKSSPFYKKSLQMGNGWNAKGLKKAKQGLWQDALACWDNALEIRIQVLGTWHVDVANTYNNRGIALGKLGKWDAAVFSLEQALQIRKQVLGSHHSQVAATMHNLANVHHQAGDLQGAILLLAQCKGIYANMNMMQQQQEQESKSSLGEQQVARACVAMGHVYFEAAQYCDATEAYLEALQIYKQLGTSEEDHHVLEIREDLQQLERIMLQQQQQQQ